MNKKKVPDPKEYPVLPPDMDYLYFEGGTSYPPEPDNTGYSKTNAWWFAEASFLAYCHPGFARMAYRLSGFEGFRFFHGTGTEAMVAWNNSMMIVAFRGTELKSSSALHEVLTDLNAASVPFERGGTVHKGFLLGLEEVWEGDDGLKNFLQGMIKSIPERPLWICGHSLGAALAALCFARIPEARGLYLYGSPRVGDQEFVNLFSDRCVWRFEHARDPVPLLPLDLPALQYFYRDLGSLQYIHRSGVLQRERPSFQLEDHMTRFSRTREIQSERKKDIGRTLMNAPFTEDTPRDTLDKIGEHLQLVKTEWMMHLDELQEDIGLKVDDHQPIFYAVKLWNDLVL